MRISITPLGAGQDVGRSCILVSLGDKNVLFDCGMHMAYDDERRFPDFSYIAPVGTPLTASIDAVIISHFHLDHCGSLPYLTEMCGYDGPIYMTHPTRAMCPLLLEDYRRIAVDKKGDNNFFTSNDIRKCLQKVITVNIHQTIQIDDTLSLTPYYAGHVLGAAMFLVRNGPASCLYTGDYNMTPDRHLGSAWIDCVRPDVVITESTYATTVRDSKRARERDFLTKIHECVRNGGRVLIPVFALGRAQELCILLESYWERMNLTVPVYFSAGLTAKANDYYRLYITWTNQKLKQTFSERNMFDFKHIKPFDMAYVDNPGPQVLFASPGMLHTGTSYEVFRKWAEDSKNMVILPGYCVPGTVGARVLAGEKTIDDRRGDIEVNLQVKHLSFSAHADMKGIMQLIKQSGAKNVVLVHGEAAKMSVLEKKIISEFKIPCFHPANGDTVVIDVEPMYHIDVSRDLIRESYLKRSLQSCMNTMSDCFNYIGDDWKQNSRPIEGVLVVQKGENPKLMRLTEAKNVIDLDDPVMYECSHKVPELCESNKLKEVFRWYLNRYMEGENIVEDKTHVRIGEVQMEFTSDHVHTKWPEDEDDKAGDVLKILDAALLEISQDRPLVQ